MDKELLDKAMIQATDSLCNILEIIDDEAGFEELEEELDGIEFIFDEWTIKVRDIINR